MSCYSGSNNIHFNSPPMMSDGRNWTSWQPEAVINNRIQSKEGIKSNWDYRQYMQRNGLQIMKYNSSDACNEIGLESHTAAGGHKTNVPFTYNSSFDTRTPNFGYNQSDLKTPYLSREQLNMRLVSPSINTESFVNK